MINFSNLMTTIIGAFIGGLFSIGVARLQLKSIEKEKENSAHRAPAPPKSCRARSKS